MKNLQIAMVGCGGMASNYRHRYTQIDGAKLALVVDANEAVAKEAAQALGNIRWSCDFADALAPEIDMVDISTPNFLHTAGRVQALSFCGFPCRRRSSVCGGGRGNRGRGEENR